MNRYFEMTRGFLEISGNLFEVIREIRETDDINIEEWKSRLGAETVFRKDGNLYFAVQVQEAQIVTEEEEQAMKKLEDEQKIESDEHLSQTGTSESQ
jgi:hypothetical protein